MTVDGLTSLQSALARVRAALTTLGPSERRVAEAIIAHPFEVVEWSTAELASASGTSPATVIRACQTLGFHGYQHLRLELARSSNGADAEPLPADDAVTALFFSAEEAIRSARSVLDLAGVAAAVAALIAAQRVVLVGNGFSGPPLDDAAMRLASVGRAVEAPRDILAQQLATRSLQPGDVCLALSYSGSNAHTLSACRAAREGGATVIIVTSFARSPLSRLADITLVTGTADRTHEIDPFNSRLAHQLALHAITDGIRRSGDSRDARRMRDAVEELLSDGDPVDRTQPTPDV